MYFKIIMALQHKELFNSLLRIKPLPWQSVVENTRKICGLFMRVQLILYDSLTKERCIAAYIVARRIQALGKKSGWLFVALYLKQCSASLMAWRGSSKPRTYALSVPVSLTRSGIPRIIPPFHRRVIRCRGPEADQLIQLYLSFFSIIKLLLVAKKVSASLFKSICEPIKDLDSVCDVVSDLKLALPNLIQTYLPRIRTIPLHQGLEFVPTWKSLPTFRITLAVLVKRLKIPFNEARNIKSCFTSFAYELGSWRDLLMFIHARGEQWSPGCLWPRRVRYAFDKNNTTFTALDLEWFEARIGPYLPSASADLGIENPVTGKLGQSVEGGGKRRIFAIGNYMNQRLLKPVHKWVAELLKRIPMDGTFDQLAPLRRLKGRSDVYSYDLSAATDRWPLLVMFEVFQYFFGRSFSSAVVNSALATNVFWIPFVKRWESRICFTAGQPLGYYASWPLFALTHHLIVWLSADTIYPGRYFDRYAVLGDDVVIADKRVAVVYKSYVERLGVSISELKSLISNTGCAEFAKRFLVNNMSEDISPVSLRCLNNYYHPNGLCAIRMKYTIKRFSTFCRIGGSGYKTLSGINSTSSLTILRRRAMWYQQDWPIELFLGRGKPLNPYLVGHLVSHLQVKLKPRDLKLPPEHLFEQPGMLDIQEYSLIRNWMSQWLHVLYWYTSVALSPEVTLEDLLEKAPIITESWKIDQKDENLIRFGRLWQCYDMVGRLTLDYRPPILPCTPPLALGGYLLGGYSGTSYMVCTLGLEQPGVRNGVVTFRGATPYKTIRYKTLGVSDRQIMLGYTRTPVKGRASEHAS